MEPIQTLKIQKKILA